MRPVILSVRRTPLAIAITAVLSSGFATMAAAQEGANSTYDEITVTARKREENIQDIPVAVSAVTASQIEDLNIQDLSEVSKLTAGLVFDNEFGRGSNRPVIRGQANILGDSGVSYFIDGVYINGSIADYDLNDIERIEVVKGPQSALYGRNTYSGAINIITKSPGDSFTSDIRYMLSDDDENMISASMRGPIIADTLSGGLTYRYYKLDDPWTNTFDGTGIGSFESTSWSGVLNFTPNDKLDIRLRGYYSERDDGQPPLFSQDSSFNNCFEDNGSLYGGLGRYFC
ncbi:MAG: TonB-dependent receptor plug domain-containing protein, partial [Pseudomonadota bacterium]